MLIFSHQRAPFRSGLGIPTVDWSHNLSNGLLSCFAPAGQTLLDVVKPRSPSQATIKDGSLFGNAIWPSTSTGYLALSGGSDTPDLNWTSGPFSVATWVVLGAASSQANADPNAFLNIFMRSNYVSESSNQGWTLQYRPTNAGATHGFNFLIFGNNSVSSYGFTNSIGWPNTNTNHMIAGSSDGASTKSIWYDLTKTTGTSGNFAPPSCANGPQYFQANTGNLIGYGGLYVACVWNRVLADWEFNQFYYEGPSFLVYPEDMIFSELVGVSSVVRTRRIPNQPLPW